MERRKALALAGAATLVLGTSVVAASALGGLGLLGFGASEASGIGAFSTTPTTVSQHVVTRTRDVYDKYVVDDSSTAPVAGGGAGIAPGATPPGWTGGSTGALPAAAPSGPGIPALDPPESPPTTRRVDDPSPTSTPAPPTTPHEDDNWPPGSTVAPPPNCAGAHWDDGHWVCGDD